MEQHPVYGLNDTIYALASGMGVAGVAVIRVSGPAVGDVITHLVGSADLKPRYATFKTLYNQAGTALDQAVVLYFKAPFSFTGEDVVEFQVHGGRRVIQSVLNAVAEVSGCRPAERGEFSRRAVLNGKMDLTQAEGLLDVIHAETEAQRQVAFSQMNGVLKDLYDGWRHTLKHHMAYLEAFIDFPEEDIPPEKLTRITADIADLIQKITVHLDDNHAGQKLRAGFSIALVGVPNVGKSSLINALTRKDVAIVSQTAGTTRDVVEAHLDVDGFPIILADTAGLREQADEIESEGIRRALNRALEADLVLNIQDASHYPYQQMLPEPLQTHQVLTVWNKIDVQAVPDTVCGMSAKTGAGIEALWARIRALVAERFSGNALITRERYRCALGECVDALARAQQVPEIELKAEELRLAARALGRITGRIENDELLDIIFRDFCIGK